MYLICQFTETVVLMEIVMHVAGSRLELIAAYGAAGNDKSYAPLGAGNEIVNITLSETAVNVSRLTHRRHRYPVFDLQFSDLPLFKKPHDILLLLIFVIFAIPKAEKMWYNHSINIAGIYISNIEPQCINISTTV
jgi:hypothetical protein